MADILNFNDFLINEEKGHHDKWMQKAFSKNKGKLHKKLGISQDKSIPMSLLNKKINALKKKEDKTEAELTLQRELVAARNAKKSKK